ncbi:MAG: chondroitinase-B domain-containing protein [Nonlabens sp.]
MNKSLFLFLVACLLGSSLSDARNFTVSSAAQFNALSLQPCDIVTWANGTYSNQDIRFSSNGTRGNPIVLKAETSGGVVFTGSSTLKISGDYIIMDGFYWNGGIGENNHVEFRAGGSNSLFANNSIIRNCAWNDLVTAGDDKSRWITLYGSNNKIENCSFLNKNSTGVFILVELRYQTGGVAGHEITNNYFFNVTDKDGRVNSGDSEAIRIGTSDDQNTNAGVLVEHNYFKEVNGENEIISNKSLGNTYRRNTFRSSRGSLVLRHGAQALVERNYFLGENKDRSGGIRVSDQDHVIINNYMQELDNSGATFNNGITLMGGNTSSGGTSNGYQNVSNVLIAFNTIYDSDDPIYFNGSRGSNTPQGTIANNLISSNRGTLVSGDISSIGSGMTYSSNILNGSAAGIPTAGNSTADPQMSASGEIFKPLDNGPAGNGSMGNYPQVVEDIEGAGRLSSIKDVGAHEVLSASSAATDPTPISDSEVGNGVGSCFLDFQANPINSGCELVDYSTICVPVAVTGINITPDQIDLAVGDIFTPSVTIQPSDAANVDVTWFTDDASIASVDPMGLITAIASGAVSVTGTTIDGGFTDSILVNVLSPPSCITGTNLALNKNLLEISSEQTGNEAANLVDGDLNNRWSANSFPQSVVVDLGTELNVGGFNMRPYQNRDYQYTVEGSTTSSTSGFSMMLDRSGNTESTPVITDMISPQVVRYVRFTVTGAATYTGPWCSIQEIEVVCAGVLASNDNVDASAIITVSPNPFNDYIDLQITQMTSSLIDAKLFDLNGRLIVKTLVNAGENRIYLPQDMNPGIYFLKITDGNKTFIKKMVKR